MKTFHVLLLVACVLGAHEAYCGKVTRGMRGGGASASTEEVGAEPAAQVQHSRPALQNPDDRVAPPGLIKPDPKMGKNGQAKMETPEGEYVADRYGRAETIDYQFVKPGSRYTLEVKAATEIPGFTDDATWNVGAAERYLPDAPYFDDVNMGLPNKNHASDHLPLDVEYALTNTATDKTASIKVKQFNILAERAAFRVNFQFAPMYLADDGAVLSNKPLTYSEYKKTYKRELLDMGKREPVLIKDMMAGGPDVLTFEEVDNQDMWVAKLKALGYTSVAQMRSFGAKTIAEKHLDVPEKFDGNLVAWKTGKFAFVAEKKVVYDESMFKKKYERSGLLVKLKCLENDAEFIVGGTHLSYDNISQQGLKQQLNEATQYVAAAEVFSAAGEVPVIMNGDFNSVPTSAVVAMVQESGFESAYKKVYGEEPPATSAYPSSVYFVAANPQAAAAEPPAEMRDAAEAADAAAAAAEEVGAQAPTGADAEAAEANGAEAADGVANGAEAADAEASGAEAADAEASGAEAADTEANGAEAADGVVADRAAATDAEVATEVPTNAAPAAADDEAVSAEY